MKNKLIYKFISGFIAAMLLTFLTVSLAVNHLTYRHMLQKEADRLYHEATVIATSYGSTYFGGSLSPDDLQKQLAALNAYLECDILLLGTDGKIIIDNAGLGLEYVEEFDPTDGAAGHHRIGYFYNVYDSRQLTVLYPVEYRYAVLGYIVINKPVSDIKADANSIFNYNYITMAIAFCFAGILIFIFYTSVNKPLRRLTNATSLYAKGNFSVRSGLGRNDEIGRLADSLDYMAMEIESLNGYQTKFIANISHDFRSPLTSIKGYLEAMLDGTIPPQLQEKYLNIVISETERLTKLTNDLLTMNNLNENGMVLDVTDFDIVRIIKQTIETCEGICEKKRIKFKLVFSEKELYVSADQGKIQQVIYNLIDNAVKFSNNDSSIIVSASEKGDRISISIKDFGIGIPKESIPKIWERFYKTDLSRGKDKKGTGLGLSIVKDIITAHREYIDVVSTEGVGTEFIFALPKAKNGREELI